MQNVCVEMEKRVSFWELKYSMCEREREKSLSLFGCCVYKAYPPPPSSVKKFKMCELSKAITHKKLQNCSLIDDV